MTFNKPNTRLDECIFVAKNIIPSDICENIIQDLETRIWEPHTWYNNVKDESKSHKTKELEVQSGTPELHKILKPFVIQAGKKYNQEYSYKHPSSRRRIGQIMHSYSPIRFNRYSSGQIMRQHHDHINSIFDGKLKGIPVLSFIFNFNDDYEGSDLFFWKDTVVKLGKGDIVMFPSNFLFPHGVTESTKGKRYSAVCWGW